VPATGFADCAAAGAQAKPVAADTSRTASERRQRRETDGDADWVSAE